MQCRHILQFVFRFGIFPLGSSRGHLGGSGIHLGVIWSHPRIILRQLARRLRTFEAWKNARSIRKYMKVFCWGAIFFTNSTKFLCEICPIFFQNLSKISIRGLLWGGSLTFLAPSWPILTPSWPILPPRPPEMGAMLAHLGPMLAPSWRHVRPSWRHVGPSWSHVGLSWTYVGSS